MEKIILISAKSGHGKTESANYLQKKIEEQGLKVARLSFAYYLKDYLKRFYGWDGETRDEIFRTNAQVLGTEVIRIKLQDPSFHVRRVCEDMRIIYDDFDVVIIDDCRFPNEMYHVLASFPKETMTVRIQRLGYKTPLTKQQQNHPSETSLDDFKFDNTIYAQSNIQHLQDELDRVFRGILY